MIWNIHMTEQEAVLSAPTPPEGPSIGPITFKRDWRHILKRAWSIKLILVAATFSGAEAALPFAKELGYMEWMPGGVFALVAFFISFAALISRLLAQSNMPSKED